MSPGLLVAALLGQAGLCGPVVPDAVADPAGAEAYREVAETEQAAGERETALVAWREVLRRMPEDPRAREALATLCAAAPAEDSAATALLQGLAHFERGEASAATAAFRTALAAPELVDTASFFLGLLALEEGQGPRAGAFFDAAARSPDAGLARRAEALRWVARREGRLALRVRLGGEYDSNVDLVPDGTRRQGGSADGVGSAQAGLSWRPQGTRGPFAHLTGHVRRHQRWGPFDLAGARGTLGWAHEHSALRLSAEYGFEGLVLGATPYLLVHRAGLAAQAPRGPVVLEATLGLHRKDFLETAFAGYSGWGQSARLEAAWRPVEPLTLSAGWQEELLAAHAPRLGFLEHGPRVSGSLSLSPRVRLLGEVGGSWRRHGAYDAVLEVRREDTALDVDAVLEWDMAAHWSLQATLGWRRAASNVPELSHERLVGGLSLVWARGWE
jgi:tetratricopeptide (TPR) repeat protein